MGRQSRSKIDLLLPKALYITESGVESTFEVTQQMLTDFNFETLEHVTVRVWIDHKRRGDVEVELISPNGITSVLSPPEAIRRRKHGLSWMEIHVDEALVSFA